MIFPSFPSMIAGLCFGVAIASAAYFLKSLSRSGAIAAATLGTIIFGLGGIAHTAVLLAFFVSSSLLSVIFKNRKKLVNEKYAKGHRRDAGQVLANGGVAGLCVILGAVYPDQSVFWWMYCAALAGANADTWATELGILSPVSPRLITNLHQVEMGTSGGVTMLGSAYALLGSLFIAAVAFIFKPGLSIVVWITLAGFAGSLVDSLLGASVQSIYYCSTCHKETEKHPLHGCGSPTRLIRGWRWLDNDWVNTFCTLSAAILIGCLFHILK